MRNCNCRNSHLAFFLYAVGHKDSFGLGESFTYHDQKIALITSRWEVNRTAANLTKQLLCLHYFPLVSVSYHIPLKDIPRMCDLAKDSSVLSFLYTSLVLGLKGIKIIMFLFLLWRSPYIHKINKTFMHFSCLSDLAFKLKWSLSHNK